MKRLLFFMMPVLFLVVTSCDNDIQDITGGGGEEADPVLDINKTSLMFTKEGTAQEIGITSNQKWEILIQNADWLAAETLKGEGNMTVEFTALPNYEIEERTNLITVKSETITKEINVTQLAADPILEVDEKSISFNYQGGTKTLEITSNTEWEIVIENEDNWITADVYSGRGDGMVTLTIPEYYGKEDRDADIILKSPVVEDDIEIEVYQTFPKTVGLWILSEAGALQTTADLAYYDYVNDELKTKFFSEQNGETLGQVANFMGLYGSNLYIAMSGESGGTNSTVQVVNAKTGKLVKTIPMSGEHGEGDLARQLAFHDGKVYVTSYFGGGKGEPGGDYLYYGGVVKIDTASLSIEGYTRVGDKPEGIIYHDGKLLVCNNSTAYGTTMSIVDVATFTEERTVTVPQNPVYIRKAANGDIYLSTPEIFLGNPAPSALHKLNPTTYQPTTYDMRVTRFAITDKYVYSGEFDWYVEYTDIVNRLDRQTGAVTRIDLDHSFFMVYGFDSNPVTGEIYVGGQGDDVIIMTEEGEKLKTFNVGVPYVNQFIPIFE